MDAGYLIAIFGIMYNLETIMAVRVIDREEPQQ